MQNIDPATGLPGLPVAMALKAVALAVVVIEYVNLNDRSSPGLNLGRKGAAKTTLPALRVVFIVASVQTVPTR